MLWVSRPEGAGAWVHVRSPDGSLCTQSSAAAPGPFTSEDSGPVPPSPSPGAGFREGLCVGVSLLMQTPTALLSISHCWSPGTPDSRIPHLTKAILTFRTTVLSPTYSAPFFMKNIL